MHDQQPHPGHPNPDYQQARIEVAPQRLGHEQRD